MRRCMTAFLAIGLVGCSFSGQPVKVRPKAVKIQGEDVTAEQKKSINFALNQLPEDFKNSLNIIDIVKDHKHFVYFYEGTKRYAIGHANFDHPDKVCLRYDSVDSPLVWHEIAHVYTYASYSFERKWERLAGDVYDENWEDYSWEMPSDGLLTSYGRKDHMEDIAEWVESCYIYLYQDKNYWIFQNSNLKKDKRYMKKLVLLQKYGFVSYSDYKKLKPLFE